jgi:hypothetical protein
MKLDFVLDDIQLQPKEQKKRLIWILLNYPRSNKHGLKRSSTVGCSIIRPFDDHYQLWKVNKPVQQHE